MPLLRVQTLLDQDSLTKGPQTPQGTQTYASLYAVTPPSPTPRYQDTDSDSEFLRDTDLSFDSRGSRILF